MAAEESGEESLCIYDTINTTMYNIGRLSFSTRPTRCLKPFANTATQTPTFPPLSGESQPFIDQRIRKPLYVDFEGWTNAPRKWRLWKNRVFAKHLRTWREARINEAIESSLYHVPRRQEVVLELLKYWCPSTNTFALPWGEAAITLEDVWILGGYSVLGSPVSLPLKTESVEKFDKMLEFQIDMFDRDPKNEKPEQVNWMEYFMDDQIEKNEEHDEELEHIAFLSMWLSRFVFPYKDPQNGINKDIFAIAIHLSEGTRLALAPAVLAGVYHFMTLLKQKTFLPYPTVFYMIDESEILPGPFEVVHQWALERFPPIAPPPRCLTGQPRAARWHRRDLGHNAINVSNNFLWSEEIMFKKRPYASDIMNWTSHYKDDDRVVIDGSGSDKDLSFGVCLCACELEGVAGVHNQKYMPHRVTMQFGIDQHFPGEFCVMKPDRMDKFSFYVPAKDYEPTVSVGYIDWWGDQWEDYIIENNMNQAAMMGLNNIHIIEEEEEEEEGEEEEEEEEEEEKNDTSVDNN